MILGGKMMLKADICIVGASLGGVMAAYQACKMGKKVVMTEETSWIGGQLTSQAVPPDEHPWIESQGCTKSYRAFRDTIRAMSMEAYEYKEKECLNLNPGLATVSRLAHQPKMALEYLNQLLLPYIASRQLQIFYNICPSQAVVVQNPSGYDHIKQLHFDFFSVEAHFFVDATDQGDLFPIVGENFMIGADGNRFGEPHADVKADPKDLQPVTWVAALEWMREEQSPIPKPKTYDECKNMFYPIRENVPKKVLSWWGPDSSTLKTKEFSMFEGGDKFSLWTYRRIYTTKNQTIPKDIRGKEVPMYVENNPIGDVILLNWPQNDYFMGNILENDHHKEEAKELTRCLVYWLQTEAPRSDGKKGYSNIALNKEVLGTEDGLAHYPYIREGRRLDAKKIVIEQDLTPRKTMEKVACFSDSVGVGSYHLDLHMTTSSHRFMYGKSLPFEIPLGMFVSKKIDNVIPGSKNVGTTHITNSCFRLHPVEWNIGEVAGLLSAYCMDNEKTVQEVYEGDVLNFQSYIEAQGIQLHWSFPF